MCYKVKSQLFVFRHICVRKLSKISHITLKLHGKIAVMQLLFSNKQTNHTIAIGSTAVGITLEQDVKWLK